MIILQHNLSDAELAVYMPRLRRAFALAGQAFDELNVRFERAAETGRCFTLQIEELALKFRTAADDAKLFAGCTLRETAWERRNTNAPWWRQFQSKQRR